MTAPGYRRGRCSVTGKAQYTTRRIAKRVARGFNDNSKPFLCRHCGLFHLGHLKNLSRAEHREYHGWGVEAPESARQTIDQQGGAGDMQGAQEGHRRPLRTTQGESQ